MESLFAPDPWKLAETALHRDSLRLADTLLSTGNAHMGIRGGFEETRQPQGARLARLAGVWQVAAPQCTQGDALRPAHGGRLPGVVDPLRIDVAIGGARMDLLENEVGSFYRALDMETGILLRKATLRLPGGSVALEAERFASVTRKELLAIRYAVTPAFDAEVVLTPAIEACRAVDASRTAQADRFPCGPEEQATPCLTVCVQGRESGAAQHTVFAAMHVGREADLHCEDGRAAARIVRQVAAGETVELIKLVCLDAGHNHPDAAALRRHVLAVLHAAHLDGYATLRAEQVAAWRRRWDSMDATIGTDMRAQQGIRYGLFQLLCTYDGPDARHGIPARGLTGEAGNAVTTDAELFCLPVILSVLGKEAGRNFLRFRQGHLEKAVAQARRAGCEGALFPMATFDGSECDHSLFAQESIHRNAAVLYAILLLRKDTGDDAGLQGETLAVMLSICRYWVSRVTWHEKKRRYMLLGVTGPNAYAQNVQNNWYTNRMAKYCLEETARLVRTVIGLPALAAHGSHEREISRFERVARKMYLPEEPRQGIFWQEDGYADKARVPAAGLDPAERPIHRRWTGDRVLRSCFLRRADVLQGIYLLRHGYDAQAVLRQYAYYAPMAVHEGAASYCVHAILAADVGAYAEAAAMFEGAVRLDLDDLTGDTADGLHLPALCGGWLALAKGFAGIRTEEGILSICPRVPWAYRTFSLRFRVQGRLIECRVAEGMVSVTLREGALLRLQVYDECVALGLGATIRRPLRDAEPPPGAAAAENKTQRRETHGLDTDV